MKRDGLTLGWGMAGCAWIAGAIACRGECAAARRRQPASPAGRRTSAPARTRCWRSFLRENRCADRQSRSGARRHLASPRAGLGRFDGDRVDGAGGFCRGGKSHRVAVDTIATTTPGSPFEKRKPEELAFEADGSLSKRTEAGEGVAFADMLRRANIRLVTGSGKSEGTFGEREAEVLDAFVRLSLRRGHMAAGDRAAARQSRCDRDRCRAYHQSARGPQPNRRRRGDGHRHGAVGTHDIRPAKRRADESATSPTTSMAVNADMPSIEVHFLDYPDMAINELGARGIGEIGLAGVAAAITAATYHATGVRVRELPVKIEDLLTSSVLA